MAEVSASNVMALRNRTNAPMMECKAALTEAKGDMEKAVEILRKKSKDVVDKKVGRETAEGRIAAFVDADKRVGGLIELRCESAPVAKSDLFVQLANDVARQVALQGAASPEAVLAQPFVGDPKKTVNDRITETVGLIRENMKLARAVQMKGLVGSYIHHDGTVGVMVQVDGQSADPQLLRDVCMHITARNPVAARREDVAAEIVKREKEVAESQVAADPKNKNKPANILEMIIEGKLKTWYAENVLLEQPFVKDDTRSVGDLLKSAGLTLVQFVRYKLGEIS
jgi:elongation factor Ts